ncbi:ATP-binding protein [Mycoplasmopsis mucosicanis]|uniref:ATP-binding protein n=1 Tax=Mycoplasmopsis mucosicanis TaxID=458208 RepID=A0A507SQK5_9BACT|nr:DEAD/DEAH box helicase [Mycoplasmopsis mucosicanis]TQC51413.1 ATP-binding protein [Mycoplasmopsis mucosicanis]
MFSENEKKYKSILNNLLDVSPNDKAIFCRTDNKYYFDFYKLFGEETYDKIYKHHSFSVDIIEQKLLRATEQLLQCSYAEQVQLIINEYDLEVSEYTIRLVNKNFEQGLQRLIEELTKQYQKQSIKWKLFLEKAKEINEQSNIWPIHLGFLFVKVKIDDKVVYGPLFVKEAYLTIENARPKLHSTGDIKVNEKLLFLLTNANFDLNTNIDISRLSIAELINIIKENYTKIYQNIPEINAPFINIETDKVQNESLEFCPGIVLGLFQPSGGYIRNRMMDIIKKDEINSIFKVDFHKANNTKRIQNYLFHPRKSLFKITPSNYSQDQAVASSLLQNTLIWGPPGTGKSQTIVNLLTNILMYKKTALVCSQKRAALDVIIKRMGELRMFCLYMSNTSSTISKKKFYEPLQKYINYLEYLDNDSRVKGLPIISQKEFDYINNIQELSENPQFLNASKVIPKLSNFVDKLDQKHWEILLNLPDFLIYPNEIKFENIKQAQKNILKVNGLYWNIFSKKRRRVKELAVKIYENFNNSDLNINELKLLTSNFDIQDLDYINKLVNITPPAREQISDVKELKKYIASYILAKMDNFSDEEKAQYLEFSSVIRTAKVQPYKFINNFASLIKKLFPIILITPETEMSEWQREEFDYAVLDESSQIFVEKGLPVVYLAKIKVLAGDKEQMKPSNWFGVRVSDDETVYGMTESLLDFGMALSVHSILLNKNYRSNHAALMTFSSKHFYNSSLDVIDSAGLSLDAKPIEVYEVNGIWEDNSNQVELDLALDLVKQNLEKYEKIILLCFNSKQQDTIMRHIFESEPELENALKNDALLLRNIENIQGDEADLVIATLGYDANATIHATYVGRPGGKNALNVAISRAKDKMIVIKSLKANDVKTTTANEDMYAFKKWLEFLELSDDQRKEFITHKQQSENDNLDVQSELFEEIFDAAQELIKDKPYIKLFKNYALGTLKVDIMLQYYDQNVYAILVDDYQYANDPNKYLEFNDIAKFIRAKGYTLSVFDRLNWEKSREDFAQFINSLEVIDKNEDITEEQIQQKTFEMALETFDDKYSKMSILDKNVSEINQSDAVDEANDNKNIDVQINEKLEEEFNELEADEKVAQDLSPEPNVFENILAKKNDVEDAVIEEVVKEMDVDTDEFNTPADFEDNNDPQNDEISVTNEQTSENTDVNIEQDSDDHDTSSHTQLHSESSEESIEQSQDLLNSNNDVDEDTQEIEVDNDKPIEESKQENSTESQNMSNETNDSKVSPYNSIYESNDWLKEELNIDLDSIVVPEINIEEIEKSNTNSIKKPTPEPKFEHHDSLEDTQEVNGNLTAEVDAMNAVFYDKADEYKEK